MVPGTDLGSCSSLPLRVNESGDLLRRRRTPTSVVVGDTDVTPETSRFPPVPTGLVDEGVGGSPRVLTSDVSHPGRTDVACPPPTSAHPRSPEPDSDVVLHRLRGKRTRNHAHPSLARSEPGVRPSDTGQGPGVRTCVRHPRSRSRDRCRDFRSPKRPLSLFEFSSTEKVTTGVPLSPAEGYLSNRSGFSRGLLSLQRRAATRLGCPVVVRVGRNGSRSGGSTVPLRWSLRRRDPQHVSSEGPPLERLRHTLGFPSDLVRFGPVLEGPPSRTFPDPPVLCLSPSGASLLGVPIMVSRVPGRR